MQFCELREGDRVRLGGIRFVVESLSTSTAVLASAGRWSVLHIVPDGRIGMERNGRVQLTGDMLEDVVPASSS